MQETQSDKKNVLVEKTISVFGYGGKTFWGDRKFADLIDPKDTDYQETELTENVDYYILVKEDDGEERRIKMDEEDIKALKKVQAFNPSNKSVRIHEDKQTSATFRNSPRIAGQNLLNVLVEELPEELIGVERTTYMPYWFEKGNKIAYIQTRGIKKSQILNHHQKRTSEERYETEDEYPCVEFFIKFKGTEEEVTQWTQDVSYPFIHALAKSNGINKVRISDCKKKTVETGECYNV